jgi:hypothetical protein
MAVKGFILQSHSYGAGSRDFTFLSRTIRLLNELNLMNCKQRER